LRAVGEPNKTIRIPIINTVNSCEGSEWGDSDTDAEMTKSSPGDAGKTAVAKIAKYTSPAFEESGLSVGNRVGIVSSMGGSSVAAKPLPSGNSKGKNDGSNQLQQQKGHRKSEKVRKIIQSSPYLVEPIAVKCRACDAEFPRKQELLEHLARKKADRKHRIGSLSYSLTPDGFVPLPSKRVRFEL
jgi:hypothetical protein